MKIYALYHGDTFLKVGNRKELAEYLGVKEQTIYFYTTEIYAKRKNYDFSNSYLVIEVEDE